jgi:hypothetical protein
MKFLIVLFTALLIISCESELSQNEMAENQLQISSEGFKFSLFKRNSVEIPSTKGQVYIVLSDVIGRRAELVCTNGSNVIFSEVLNSWSPFNFELNGKWYELKCNYIANRLIKRDKCSFTIRLTEPPNELESF